MQTDISVRTADRKIIVDTKYYRETLSEYYDSEKIHSSNLYQLLSYLMNARKEGATIEGILLYPTVDRDLKVDYLILGFHIQIRTLNLAQPWQAIRDELKTLVN